MGAVVLLLLHLHAVGNRYLLTIIRVLDNMFTNAQQQSLSEALYRW